MIEYLDTIELSDLSKVVVNFYDRELKFVPLLELSEQDRDYIINEVNELDREISKCPLQHRREYFEFDVNKTQTSIEFFQNDLEDYIIHFDSEFDLYFLK